MEIKNKIPYSNVEQKYKIERDGKRKQRLLIILKAYKIKSSYKIGKEVNVSHTKVQRWIKRFNKKGFEGIDDKMRSGRPSELNKKQILELKKLLDRKSEFRAGYNTIEILHKIKIDFKVNYSQRHVRRLLHKLNYSLITPRSSHIKKDPVKNKQIVGDLKKTYRVWKKIG